jgi:hypothetical protein
MSGRKDQVKFVDIPDIFREDAAVLYNWELAKKYNRSLSQIVRWRRVVQVISPVALPGGSSAFARYDFPDPEAKDYSQAGIIKITGDCMITSDWHVPYHDVELCKNMVRLADKLKIKQLAIVGDLFDGATLSIFDPQDIAFDVGEELRTTQQTLLHLLKFFDRIYWCLGNHEMRFLRSVKFQLDLVDLAGFLVKNDKVATTPLPYMVLESGGYTFRLTHPRSYSRIAMRVAAQLALNFQTNVMAAHGHLFGFCMDASNRFRCIDLGGMFDAHKLAYKVVGGDTTHPMPSSGFWVMRNGITTPYSNSVCDWEFVLGGKK